MPNTRLFLLVAIAAVGYLLWVQWQQDYAPEPAPVRSSQAPSVGADIPSIGNQPVESDDVPQPAASSQNGTDVPSPTPTTVVSNEAALLQVRTDVLDLQISKRGGAIVSARLLDYLVDVKQKEPVTLLAQLPQSYFVAESGLVSTTHQAPDHTKFFDTARSRYELSAGVDQLIVPLTWVGPDGTRVTKRYHFQRGSYAVHVSQEIANDSGQDWVGSPYWQLVRTPPGAAGGSIFTSPERFSFTGVALYTETEHYEKYDFDDLTEQAARYEQVTGWAAMVQHYFIAAWLPPADQSNNISAQSLPQSGRFRARLVGASQQIPAGTSQQLEATLWLGPKLQDQLEPLGEGLELTVDYGIFTPFSKVLFWLMDKIHVLVGNWGVAIILLTVLVKLVFFKLTEAQYKSMARMRKLQPRIVQLKERYGSDKQKFNMAMMEIYKKEKVNPLGGCLPVLIQIPVFIALYWVLVESVELRQAPFVLWIQDLSSPDPYFILPLINGVAMFMTTKLSPNPAADPIQQRIMLALPIAFSVMFAFFQAGLVLYWAVNSVLSLAQQLVITKRIEAGD